MRERRERNQKKIRTSIEKNNQNLQMRTKALNRIARYKRKICNISLQQQ